MDLATEILQLVINGIVAGTILAVPAIGITTIYAVLRFPNFALASIATIGAFAGYVANTGFGIPPVGAVLVAFVVAGLVGEASDELVLKPIRPVGLLAAGIASVALTIALENVVRLVIARGYLIVAAVGNDGPAAPPLYPASYPDVVGVTAVDARERADIVLESPEALSRLLTEL